jgi:DNA polymerase
MNKEEKLKRIVREIENCKVCKLDKHGKAVPGEGSADADIMFVGEAPGRTEAKTGRPFVGRSGKLLRSLITNAGLKEEDVYITSPVKYLPDYITPTKEDIVHGKTHFDKQVEIINPKMIVLLGRVGALAVLNKNISVVKEHGKIIEDNGRKYFITVHPAAALRFKKMKAILEEDFKKLRGLI